METNKLNPDHRTDKAGTAAQAGALITAILASACCWLPLLLIAFGVSGGALSAKFEAVRPALLPVTFALLGLAFYFTYRKPKAAGNASTEIGEACCSVPGAEPSAESCCPPEGAKRFDVKKLNKLMLWVITVFVLAFAFFPNYVGLLLGGGKAVSVIPGANRVEWVMTIEGMTCEGCATGLQTVLSKTPSLSTASVNFQKKQVEIVADSPLTEDALQKAVADAGFTVASVTKR